MTLNRTIKRLVKKGILGTKKVGRSILCYLIDRKRTESMRSLSSEHALILDDAALRSIKKLTLGSDTIRQISLSIGIPYMTTSRAIDDLAKIGLVRIRRVGRSKLCRLDKDSKLLESYMKII